MRCFATFPGAATEILPTKANNSAASAVDLSLSLSFYLFAFLVSICTIKRQKPRHEQVSLGLEVAHLPFPG